MLIALGISLGCRMSYFLFLVLFFSSIVDCMDFMSFSKHS